MAAPASMENKFHCLVSKHTTNREMPAAEQGIFPPPQCGLLYTSRPDSSLKPAEWNPLWSLSLVLTTFLPT